MTEGIIIAVIGAAGVILAAVVGLFKSNNTGKNIKIKQKQGIGNKGTQIGIQNNHSSTDSTKGEEKDE